jgi:hypothetical protein
MIVKATARQIAARAFWRLDASLLDAERAGRANHPAAQVPAPHSANGRAASMF